MDLGTPHEPGRSQTPGRVRLCRFAAVSVLWICLCGLAPAQTNDVDVDDVMDAVQQFAQENLDPDVLRALQSVDQQQVVNFFNHYQEYLRGDYVLDTAQLKDSANAILPLLEAHEETQPYAAWLRSRMDYFDAADELRTVTPPAPKSEPGKPVPRPPRPAFKAVQEIWIKKIAPRPLPKGAAKVVPEMKSIFAAERVPTQLVWLAEVESGFDSRAESPAGAAGMFQLMPATAKRYGLSLWPWDQRRQPEAAAEAAAKYLRTLDRQFGDWRLAVAAYDCGPELVQKVLERHHARSYERIAMHLPAETQMYVPKVEATILHREGAHLEDLHPAAL
ncbi:MAG TPA: lytic transglycosylase domain-containing protein [Candidatus Acidoferrales bacterium]|nr:lytic transglycosylase domain-containing protein [Candidatus Acidoferrales bacterium]